VVTGVQIGNCNGDAAVRESIEAAVYRASPLPTPSNPDLFDRSLKFNFHPDE
jgi:colicin import membrane protein